MKNFAKNFGRRTISPELNFQTNAESAKSTSPKKKFRRRIRIPIESQKGGFITSAGALSPQRVLPSNGPICQPLDKDTRFQGNNLLLGWGGETRKFRAFSPKPKLSSTFFADSSFSRPKVADSQKKKICHNLVELISDAELEQMKRKIWGDYNLQRGMGNLRN